MNSSQLNQPLTINHNKQISPNMGTAAKKPRAKRSVRSGRKKMEIFQKNQEIINRLIKELKK